MPQGARRVPASLHDGRSLPLKVARARAPEGPLTSRSAPTNHLTAPRYGTAANQQGLPPDAQRERAPPATEVGGFQLSLQSEAKETSQAYCLPASFPYVADALKREAEAGHFLL